MDNFQPQLHEEKKQSFFGRHSKSLKVVTIAILVLLLLIPMGMIESLIRERQYTQKEAYEDVSQKWSKAQTITGPFLNIRYTTLKLKENTDEYITETSNLLILPDELNINGDLETSTRNRGIYDVNVYQSGLNIQGVFSYEELKKLNLDTRNIHFKEATLCFEISDLRGISEQIKITWKDSTYTFEPGTNGNGFYNIGVNTIIDASDILESKVNFEMNLKLKGSQSIFFTPLGKTTKVDLKANWHTPSFTGSYLPENHNIGNENFDAHWQVLNLNRNYPQVFFMNNSSRTNIKESAFGVVLKVPVEQYQQSMRTAKYAILIILLTFTVVFFTEIMDKKRIHALQYLLIGLALCLFYSLLLSISEQMNFTLAYIISSLLTISLISLYIRGIMKRKRPALIMAGLLSILYLYIFILIQLETLALLAGSLGLFIILAVLMYFSKKINWYNE